MYVLKFVGDHFHTSSRRCSHNRSAKITLRLLRSRFILIRL